MDISIDEVIERGIEHPQRGWLYRLWKAAITGQYQVKRYDYPSGQELHNDLVRLGLFWGLDEFYDVNPPAKIAVWIEPDGCLDAMFLKAPDLRLYTYRQIFSGEVAIPMVSVWHRNRREAERFDDSGPVAPPFRRRDRRRITYGPSHKDFD